MEAFSSLIFDQLTESYYRFARFVPNILAMFIIILVGIGIVRIVRAIMLKILRTIKFDTWSDRMGLTSFMRKGDLWNKPSMAVASFVYWFLIIGVLMVGISSLNIQAMDSLVTRFVTYGPKLLSATLIVVIGYIATGFISRAVLISAVNRGFIFARFIAEAVRVLLTVLFIAMTLDELEVAPRIVVTAFAIIFGGIILGLSISFGVGGIDAARKVIESETEKKEEEKQDIQHI
ncbi:MAG: mechanosensitive ion channel family protein [Nitrospirota bacterium]